MHDFDSLREINLLKYLLEQIDTIGKYVEGYDEDMFLRNSLVKDASLMKLIVLGEFSARIDERLKSRFTGIQWQFIKAARNYYAHVYNGVDWRKVWDVIVDELPDLKTKIEEIIVILEKENNAEIN